MTFRARAVLGGAALLATAALAVPAATTTAPAAAAPAATVTEGCLASVPEPGGTTPVKICYSVFKPASASSRHRVPMLMHSHGWGGSRTTDPASFAAFTDAGYGVISFD